VSPASAGNVFGCGLRVLGVVRVRDQGWFGRRLSAQYSLSFSCPRFARAGLITARKGDVRAVISLPILHVYTRRLYPLLYGLPQTAIEHRVINC
jgi:hypothetical protein